MGGGNPLIKNDWRSMKKNKKEIVKRQAEAEEAVGDLEYHGEIWVAFGL